MLDLGRWREWRSWIPSECPGCGVRVAGQGLCGSCLADLLADDAIARCSRCGHPSGVSGCPDCARRAPAFDAVVAAFDYRGLGARLVRDFKLSGRLALAGVLADLLATAVWPLPVDGAAIDLVVPVPARLDSLRQRGFSPPAEVSRLLARRLHLRHDLDVLRRVRQGPRQSTLGRDARLQSGAEDYACAGSARSLQGRRIAVVDDVLTTGATLHAVAQALKSAGAAQVHGWVLARAVLQ